MTRIESMALVAAVGLLLAVVLPAFASDRIRINRAVCANNLSRIGMALAEWAGDYGERYPWEVSYPAGGTRNHNDAGKTWFHYAALSNQLVTPAVLVCPSDGARVRARAFDFFFRNDNVSYFLSHPVLAEGRGILAGDRNLRNPPTQVSCPDFGSAYSLPIPAIDASWTPILHANRGHLLFNDGSVEATDDGGLRQALSHPASTNSVFHYLTP